MLNAQMAQLVSHHTFCARTFKIVWRNSQSLPNHLFNALTCLQVFNWAFYQKKEAKANLEQYDIKVRMSLYCLVKCSICTHIMTNVGFVTQA